MTIDRIALRGMLERDAETAPLEHLSVPGRVRAGRHLMPDLAALFPHPLAVERYTLEIITRTLKQHAADQCLSARFVEAVSKVDAALPESVRETLQALADHAKAEPFPVEDASRLAHSICMDGELRARLMGTPPPRKRASKGDTKAAYRTLAQRLHPDRQGGDDKAMTALNVLRDAAGAR